MADTKGILCALCNYKLNQFLCGNPLSPNFNNKISGNTGCDAYIESQGLLYFFDGIAHLNENEHEDAIGKFRHSLLRVLQPDDELVVRLHLGSLLLDKCQQIEIEDELFRSQDLYDGIGHLESAVLIDKNNESKIFLDTTTMSHLIRLDWAYTKIGDKLLKTVDKKDNSVKLLFYLENKIKLFNYFEVPPLPTVLFSLGSLYLMEKEIKKANRYLQMMRILKTDENCCKLWNTQVKNIQEAAELLLKNNEKSN